MDQAYLLLASKENRIDQPRKTKSGYTTRFLFYLPRSDYLFSIGVFLFVLLLYESMAPSRLSSANFGADGGDFLTAAITKGIPHPSGYPLYLLISDLFQRIFTTSLIWRQVQVSVIPGALTTAILFLLICFESSGIPNVEKWICSLLAAIALAVSPIFWSQSVIIEVYALNAFFVGCALLWIFLITGIWKSQIKSKLAIICLLAWVCGLGLGNHTTYILLYPVVFYGIYRLIQSGMSKPLVVLCLLGWFSGLITYAILPFRAALHPPINWGDPDNLQGFIWLITGGDYHQNFFSIQPQEYLKRLSSWINIIFEQFGLLGVIVAALGVSGAKRNSDLKWTSIYVVAVYSVLAVGYKTNDSFVYLIPAFICFSLWIAWGLENIWYYEYKQIHWGWAIPAIFAISLIFAIPGHYTAVNPQNGDLADYAELTLAQAPQNGILHPENDGQTFALWYYHYGLHYRPDVRIISDGLLQYPWYREQLKRIYPELQGRYQSSLVNQ
jgi:hypothetical protein